MATNDTTAERADLPALERELRERSAAFAAAPEPERDARFAELCAIEDEIAAAPIADLADVAVKLRLVRRLEYETNAEQVAEKALDRLIADVEALARGEG